MRSLLKATGMAIMLVVISSLTGSIIESSQTVQKGPLPSESEVWALTQEIVRENPQISDPKKIQIGQLVWVPDGSGKFRAELANSWALRESRGCMYWMALEELVRRESTPLLTNPSGQGQANTAPKNFLLDDYRSSRAIIFLGLFLVGTALLFVIGSLIREIRRRRNLDPYRRPPVVPGGLGEPQSALAKIIRASGFIYRDPNRVELNAERGQVVNATGEGSFTTPVMSGDGSNRPARINHGENCWRVTVGDRRNLGQQPSVEYWLHRCGNPIGVGTTHNQFELPSGWRFVSDQPQQLVQPAAGTVTTTATEPQAPETNGALTEERVAEIVAAAIASQQHGPKPHTMGLGIKKLDGGGVAIDGYSSRFVSSIHVVEDGTLTIEFYR
ncbi:MAG TPA: hypothetical protein VJJ73_00265 [Candidatus Paceibacterota bacterium]